MVPTSTATPIPLPSFAQLSVPSGNVVWALVAGTRLFRSTDRGDTWQERPLAAGFLGNNEIAFVNDSEGWLATPASPATQCQYQSVGMAHTVDGGTKWEVLFVAAPPAATDPSGLANGKCKEHLAFADSQRGFLSGYDPNSAPVIYRTTDGGRTWSASRPLPDPPGFTTRGAGFTLRAGRVRAFGTTLLVDASGQLDGRPVPYVFRSVDGGASWSYLVTLPATEGAFAIVTASRWLQIAPPNSSKETTDGGATWHAFTTDYSQAAPIAPEVVFGDPLIGYATVRGAIQRTVDGGALWTGIRTPGT
jgi:photosystem II stability/assembly factor-like uncharacterized protein